MCIKNTNRIIVTGLLSLTPSDWYKMIGRSLEHPFFLAFFCHKISGSVVAGNLLLQVKNAALEVGLHGIMPQTLPLQPQNLQVCPNPELATLAKFL